MRGLVGNRLLKRFFGSVVHRPGFDPPQGLEPKLDDGEEAVQGLDDSSPEKSLGKREAEKTKKPAQ
jgi:hypothetical protein